MTTKTKKKSSTSGAAYRRKASLKSVGLLVTAAEQSLIHRAAAQGGVMSIARFCRDAAIAEARRVLQE